MNHVKHWWMLLVLGLAAGLAHGGTAMWSDNFETNATGNWQSSGVWKLDSPTAGPALNNSGYRTHSGANCAYTQGYGYNKDTRLVCVNYNGASTLLVPAADQLPRLRFWHWFNFGNSLGYVEITTNGATSWTQISPTYLGLNSSGVWSQPSIDLRSYAGQNIQIAFHFTTGGCCGNGLGWYVDDVEVDTNAELLTFPEGFEFDPKTTDWSVDFGTWEIGTPTSGPGSAHAGTNCAGTVLGGTYANNVDSRLISPPFYVPATNTLLRYSQWYSFNNALGYVEVNDGTTTTTTTTNITITTNTSGSLDTNVYLFSGAAISDYTNPFYWNPTLGVWTNSTKVMESVYDLSYGVYYYEAGTPPVSGSNRDYRAAVIPFPQSTAPTNYLYLHGITWTNLLKSGDTPAGYFETNTSESYTTNTTVTVNSVSWTQVSPTYEDATTGGVWTNALVDLSAYAGKGVQLAFHFTSGGLYTAAGWYVDDLVLIVPPILLVPTNVTMYAGEMLTATNVAANLELTNDTFVFRLLSAPSGVSLTTKGILTWVTSSNLPSSTNLIKLAATDQDTGLSATNSFTVTVINENIPQLTVPATQTIYAGTSLVVTNFATNTFLPDDTFTFKLVSTLWTNMDTSDLATDGVLIWNTATTLAAGTYKISIAATDDYPPNFSATNQFLVVVSKPPSPVLVLPVAALAFAGQTTNFTVAATNSAFPDSLYIYRLTNSPAGATINPKSGLVTLATTPANKIQNVTIGVVATDDHTPPLTVQGSFVVLVAPTPQPSVIVPATRQTNYAGQVLAVTVYATNSAVTNAVYTFSLLSASTNYCLTNSSTTSGVLTWTNTGIKNRVLVWSNNSVAPATNTVYIRVKDNSSWVNQATNHFSIVFLPPKPPRLLPPTNQSFFVGRTFTNALCATNDYLPGTNFTFALATPPTNGVVQTNGLAWTNTAAVPAVYSLAIKITDDSVPPLHATNCVALTVLPYSSQLVLKSGAIPSAGGGGFPLSIETPWTNTAWRILAATNLDALNWTPVYTNGAAAGGLLLYTDLLATNFPQRYYRAVFP